MLTLYQVKRLAAPASGEALRKGNKDIQNAEVADAAAVALSKLASAVYTQLEADNLFATENGVGLEATVALFQANPATGTFVTNPKYINDNATANPAAASVIGQYAEVNFGKVVRILRWRQFGWIGNDGDGEWKIQYYNLVTHTWIDWVTGIVTRVTSDWSTLDTEIAVLTDKIRLVATVIDTQGATSQLCELEVIF